MTWKQGGSTGWEGTGFSPGAALLPTGTFSGAVLGSCLALPRRQHRGSEPGQLSPAITSQDHGGVTSQLCQPKPPEPAPSLPSQPSSPAQEEKGQQQAEKTRNSKEAVGEIYEELKMFHPVKRALLPAPGTSRDWGLSTRPGAAAWAVIVTSRGARAPLGIASASGSPGAGAPRHSQSVCAVSHHRGTTTAPTCP